MQAINHSLTGALIGLTIANPIVAVPIALASHLVCDAIPHFGGIDGLAGTQRFKIMLIVDALLCGLLVLALILLHPVGWAIPAICAFAAASPDFWNVREFIYAQGGKMYKPGKTKRFLNYIQWFERPIGMIVEVAWFGAALYLLISLVG
jgi:hypothetical protein